MHILLKRILRLPDLLIKKNHWEELLALTHHYNAFHGHDFLEAIKKHPEDSVMFFPANTLRFIVNYLNEWHEIFSLLMTYNVRMVEKWREAYENEIANDDLLPLTIELIEMDLLDLKIIHRKLSQAIEIFNTGEQGYTLINLYSALEAKIQGASIQQEPNEDKKNQILHIKNKLLLEEDINKILSICVKYKRNLFSSFSHRVNFLGFNRCFNHISLESNVTLQNILSHLINEPDLSDSIQDSVLSSIIRKYIVLEDIFLSFQHKEYSSFFLYTLNEKIIQHQSILKITLRQNDYWILFKSGYADYQYARETKLLTEKEIKLHKKLSFFANNNSIPDIEAEFIFEKRASVSL